MGDIFSKIGMAMQSANSGGAQPVSGAPVAQGNNPLAAIGNALQSATRQAGQAGDAATASPANGAQPPPALNDFVRALIGAITQRAGGNAGASLLGNLGQP